MTLVEVMVASVVFSMVMLATVTALRTFATSYEKIVAEVASTDEMREVSHFLRQSLKDAVAESKHFSGDKRELVWLAPLDRAGSAAGLQYLRLRRRGDVLSLSFAPYDTTRPDGEQPAWGAVVKDYPLVRELGELEFSYKLEPFGDWKSRATVRSRDGEDVDRVPWEISIRIETAQGVWPPIIVHPDSVVLSK